MKNIESPTRTILNPGEYIVGHIENYPVIYVKDRDILFCKNTTVKYPLIKQIFDSGEDKHRIEEKVINVIVGKLILMHSHLLYICTNIVEEDLKLKEYQNQ